MNKRSFTLLVIPDTARVKAVQLEMSYLMLWLIIVVFFGSLGGIIFLLYDFHHSDQSQNIIVRNLERRQQIQYLNSDLALLERRMVKLVSTSIQEEVSIPPPNNALKGYQTRIERLRLQAEIFTPILLRKVDAVHENMERAQAIPSRWPVEGFLSSGFGYRSAPISGRWTFHSGIDIAARHGTKILSQNNGVVVVSEYQSGYGNFIEIDHGYGIRTRYGHASKLLRKVGDNVKKGDAIALVGSTGRSTGPHLHYEIRIDGVPVDPQQHVKE
jgi:murein DD-endopeptidase MepM/ murein hydrolase activator NlpD